MRRSMFPFLPAGNRLAEMQALVCLMRRSVLSFLPAGNRLAEKQVLVFLMRRSMPSFLFLLLLARPQVAQPAAAQETAPRAADARQELHLLLRDEAGRPLAGVPVPLVRLYDGAPMGERRSDAAGRLSWSLESGYEYEIHLPPGLVPHPALLAELGEMGLSRPAFRLGQAGAAPREPVTLGLVAVAGSGRDAGRTLLWDRAPEAARPEPDMPAAEEAGRPHPDGAATSLLLPPAAAEAPAPAPEAAAPEARSTRVSALLLVALLGLIAAAAGLWLRPVLRGGLP